MWDGKKVAVIEGVMGGTILRNYFKIHAFVKEEMSFKAIVDRRRRR